MVRITGTASADQAPTWRVMGTGRSTSSEFSSNALAMARPSLDQLSSSGVISSRVNVICGQTGGSARQMPVAEPSGLAMSRWAHTGSEGQGEDLATNELGCRQRVLKVS